MAIRRDLNRPGVIVCASHKRRRLLRSTPSWSATVLHLTTAMKFPDWCCCLHRSRHPDSAQNHNTDDNGVNNEFQMTPLDRTTTVQHRYTPAAPMILRPTAPTPASAQPDTRPDAALPPSPATFESASTDRASNTALVHFSHSGIEGTDFGGPDSWATSGSMKGAEA